MGSLRALQEWCRAQCEHYDGVDVKDMSSSFRDGLAFCAIIHRHRPDLIDFGSLSKENVYENNRLAFEVAEAQLGIPALLDPEDMVSMKVPDRLSVITYVSQYYNFFNANPPCMKRPGPAGHNEPAQKKALTPVEDKEGESEPSQLAQIDAAAVRRSALSSTCAACQKHVHLVQRFLVDGKLYHRNCFRCTECRSTLLPGSYKLGSESGALVCTHHLSRRALANQNGRPDLSERPAAAQSIRIGRSPGPHASGPTDSTGDVPTTSDSTSLSPATTTSAAKDADGGGGEAAEETPRSSSPPNPFDESDDDDDAEEDDEEAEKIPDAQTPATHAANGDVPSTPAGRPVPVPAPRRVSEPAPPPPRPAPRVRLQRATESLAVGENLKPPTPPKPRERSLSPGSLSSGTHKPKDPPWLALVQSESKKKKAPPRPPSGLATPPNVGSLSSLKGEGSRPVTPNPPANPFDDDDDDDDGVNEAEEDEGGDGGGGGGEIPATLAASHPWYSITRAADGTGDHTPPSGGSSSCSASPRSARRKKRPAPRAPRPPAGHQALSIESLSSGSDHSSSHAPPGGGGGGGGSTGSDQEHAFTKSVSEPSICSPSCDPAASPSSSSNELRLSPSPFPSPMSANASSAPATPQTSRSSGAKGAGTPPPRPPVNPSPLASGATHNKRICKENPFNRKASPSPAKSKNKPPKGSRPARPPAPGHGFPLIKRKVQSDQFIPVEDIHGEMVDLEKQLDQMELRGVELEQKLRDSPDDEDEERLLVDWFTLIHEKHLLVRREAELVYTAKQQNLEERQADVEYELRCLLNKPEKDWTDEDKSREQELMAELVTIIEQRNQIVNTMDQDRQRDEEEDKLMEAMLKKKDFQHKEPESEPQKKKGSKFKPMKALKRLSHKGEPGNGNSPHKEKS